jgi:hypothetical protein
MEKEVIMKTGKEFFVSMLPKEILLGVGILVTLVVAVDSALNTSHILVFFSLLFLTALFFTLYEESDEHKLGVSIASLVLGSIYVVVAHAEITWVRFLVYSGTLYFIGILFFAAWLMTKQVHNSRRGQENDHSTM